MAFAAFVTEVFGRRIVGWRTANRMPTELPLDAIEMALWVRNRAGEEVNGVIHHSDAGSQYTAIRYAERLADAGGEWFTPWIRNSSTSVFVPLPDVFTTDLDPKDLVGAPDTRSVPEGCSRQR